MTSQRFVRSECFARRPIEFHGLVGLGEYRLKRYDIRREEGSFDARAFEAGLNAGAALLPRPLVTSNRPGVGTVICHEGATRQYIVLCWWDNQNELFQRVLIRNTAGGPWRDGASLGSCCVWDLEVLWHERNAFIRHVLTPEAGPDLDRYLADVFGD